MFSGMDKPCTTIFVEPFGGGTKNLLSKTFPDPTSLSHAITQVIRFPSSANELKDLTLLLQLAHGTTLGAHKVSIIIQPCASIWKLIQLGPKHSRMFNCTTDMPTSLALYCGASTYLVSFCPVKDIQWKSLTLSGSDATTSFIDTAFA
jgi:hypothetical protein